jgi:hypothetical protein
VSAGQPTPQLHADAAALAYPRPYPLRVLDSRMQPLDREVAREAFFATATLLLVVLAAVTAIGVSGWLAG